VDEETVVEEVVVCEVVAVDPPVLVTTLVELAVVAEQPAKRRQASGKRMSFVLFFIGEPPRNVFPMPN